MRRAFIGLATFLFISTSLWISETSYAASAGGACTKSGSATKINGTSYLCQKNTKGKLVWTKKIIPIPKPTLLPPSPTSIPTPSQTPAAPKPFVYSLPSNYQEMFASPEFNQNPSLPKSFTIGHTLFDYFSDTYSKQYLSSTIDSIKASGVGWMAMDNYYTYTNLEPPVIAQFPAPIFRDYAMREASDVELSTMIKKAHAVGLKFALFSEINFSGLSSQSFGVTASLLNDEAKAKKKIGEYRDGLANPTPAILKFWDDWFASYGNFILHQADIAQQNGVEMLAIGHQLGPVTDSENLERWKSLIAKVRERYKGTLVYIASEGKNFGEANGFPAWNYLDAIMVTIGDLAPSTQGRTVNQIRDDMKAMLEERFKPLAGQYAKPVYLLSYFQAATTQDWFEAGPITGGHDFIIQDQTAQAKLYEALFQAIESEPWIAGVFTWGYWYRDDLQTLIIPGDSAVDKSSNVRNQPAMEIVRKWASTK